MTAEIQRSFHEQQVVFLVSDRLPAFIRLPSQDSDVGDTALLRYQRRHESRDGGYEGSRDGSKDAVKIG
jgi:hypothetical protein